MRKRIGATRIVVVLLALLAASIGGGVTLRSVADLAGPPNSAISLRLSNSTVAVTAGGTATVLMTVSRPRSSTGTIRLTASGVPAQVSLRLPSSVRPGVAVPVRLDVGLLAAAGTRRITVRATAGRLSVSTPMTLRVTPAPLGLALGVAPGTRTVANGASTTYTLAYTRTVPVPVVRTSVAGLPAGATAVISPSVPLLAAGSTVTVTLTRSVVPGTYPLTFSASNVLGTATATATLVVVPEPLAGALTLAGTPDRVLRPGGESARIDVAITNSGPSAATVTGLAVAITGVGNAGCTASDYAVVPYTGTQTLVVQPGQTRTLSQLGVARADMPGVRMLNRDLNQDACKGAQVSLRLTANGAGS